MLQPVRTLKTRSRDSKIKRAFFVLLVWETIEKMQNYSLHNMCHYGELPSLDKKKERYCRKVY